MFMKMKENRTDYPRPLLLIKPDLQIDDVYDLSSLKELKSDLKYFTQEDLEQALIQAQREINEELYTTQYEAILPVFPVKISQTEKQMEFPDKNIAFKNPEYNNIPVVQMKISSSSIKTSDETDSTSDEQEEEEEEEEECEIDHEEEIVGKGKEHVLKKVTELHQGSSQPARSRQKAAPPADMSADLKEGDIQYLNSCVDNMNQLFSQLIQCIQHNKAIGSVDEAEAERVAKRNREFQSRFNRSLYQVGKELVGLKNFQNRIYIKSGAKPLGTSRLKQLSRSCSNLISALLGFAPLSGGEFFPPRFPEFLELLIDLGSELSPLGVYLVEFAQSLRKVESIKSSLEREKMLETTRQLKNTENFSKKPASVSANKSASSLLNPRGTKLLYQRTNLARTRRMESDEFAGTFDKDSSSLKFAVLKRENSSVYSYPRDASRTTVLGSRQYTVVQKPGYGVGSSGVHRRVDQSTSRVQSVLAASVSAFESVECTPVHTRNPSVCTEPHAVPKSKSTRQEAAVQSNNQVVHREVQREEASALNIGSLDMDGIEMGWDVSRLSEGLDPNRIMRRLHNLELLALREKEEYPTAAATSTRETHSRNYTEDTPIPRDDENKEMPEEKEIARGEGSNGEMERLERLHKRTGERILKNRRWDLEDIISRLDMINGDFAHIEHKYRFQD